jgi:hypothetical protein
MKKRLWSAGGLSRGRDRNNNQRDNTVASST